MLHVFLVGSTGLFVPHVLVSFLGTSFSTDNRKIWAKVRVEFGVEAFTRRKEGWSKSEKKRKAKKVPKNGDGMLVGAAG
jgi:hypothetical protein